MKKSKIIAAIVLIVAVFVFGNSIYTIAENEYAAVTQFGKIQYVVSEAGANFKVPFIQSVKKIPKELMLYDIKQSDVITSDKKSMITDNYILWRITDPVKFAQTLNYSIGNAEDRSSVASYNATKNVISSMTQDEIIASRGTKLTELITNNANSAIGQYGIEIVKTEIKLLDLPDDNKEAVYERMISERNNIAASFSAEGRSEAQKIMNQTDKTVTVMLAEARKQAAVLEAEGESEYMKKLAEAYNDESKADFYTYIRSLDALKNSLQGENKTLILDKDSAIARLFY
ncbi:protease modulator HflC [Kineothrix sp. MB12-C1]|uniref:protease modulator HflC n=1 Tax=Kineothrix sp. MB12-C1 TaxID=3070215 RepID=UPI0027D1F57F|nr:protease modulator HflC [Kineothrix sp. MB12-C1]WMC93678.1 protease modulator HflC [Kineothrix sp. MB12-C1]